MPSSRKHPSVDTLEAAEKNGIMRINSYIDHGVDGGVQILNIDNVDAFHDRELILNGLDWFKNKLESNENCTSYSLIKEL